ncbi:MAG TPA: peptidyl-prolyl cis-trans isomerase, partial [Candidatus Binatia bacterium]|nr:peptidyl-prolyl cis-trans isomerase [Candidatus Binatia bacterium]
MRRLARMPALHFVLLGAALFALRASGTAVPARTLDAAEVARLRDGWRAAHGRAPDAAEEVALLDDEVLYREA